MRSVISTVMVLGLALATVSAAQLPAVPSPAENAVTEAKRVLGKILFWDEQLSSDNTVACGTCHRPGAGGADPRAGLFPGERPGTLDDVAGSPGIRLMASDGSPALHPVFGDGPQVTRRLAPSNFGALWARQQFWDGRAGSELRDPLTGEVLIEEGAALENQVLMTLMNDAEMAKQGRVWDELTSKLASTDPLALADEWPADVSSAIAAANDYPGLFNAAFDDSAITPTRIAMAIAAYQRTLISDQSPWDRFMAGDTSALGVIELRGWQAFQSLKCASCHEPPLFTDNSFAYIGLRRTDFDAGRSAVTGHEEDLGDMKVPSLRNAGLRQRYMHTGEFKTLGAAINFYRSPTSLPGIDSLPDGGAYAFTMSLLTVADLQAFIAVGLTDPRVAEETYPFDRPRLASERQ